MQHIYHVIGEFLTDFALVVLLTLLVLQFAAFRRHRHKSFVLLCFSSLCGIASASLGAVSYLMPYDLAAMVSRLEVRSIFYVVSAVLGMWGTISLFNSYRTLSEMASAKSSDCA